jgi:hypothetical protein
MTATTETVAGAMRGEYRGFYIVEHALGAAVTGTYNNTKMPSRTHFDCKAQAMGYIDCYLDELGATESMAA